MWSLMNNGMMNGAMHWGIGDHRHSESWSWS
jgi:hypothetical protein